MANYDLIQHRRDSLTNWNNINPILADGEFGVITSTNPRQFKIGDGATVWSSLPLFISGSNGEKYSSIWYTTPGTYTLVVPVGVYSITIYGCGGGGGGNSNFGLAGGGAECAFGETFSVVPGETLTITVGAGGYGAAAGTTVAGGTPIAGGDGEKTVISGSFGTRTLQGGFGGGKNGKFDPGDSGGPGGEDGGMPHVYSTGSTVQRTGGNGGNTLFGTGGKGGRYADKPTWATMKPGKAGLGFGSGGGGGGHIWDNGTTTSTVGGPGAKGMMLIEWKIAS